MKTPLFEFPAYKYKVDDWDFKKKGLLKRINRQEFYRTELQDYETDRRKNKNSYVNYLSEFLRRVLYEFCHEAQFSCSMTDAWTVKYQKGDHQTIHNHRSWGFSGILYVEYDPKVHTPTVFVAPWQNPIKDTTLLSYPSIDEGGIVIAPSCCLHYAEPNRSRKQRTIVAFDLLPNLPIHHSINIDE